jgi:hypothetical protein
MEFCSVFAVEGYGRAVIANHRQSLKTFLIEVDKRSRSVNDDGIQNPGGKDRARAVKEQKKEDEICTSSISSSTIPLTSGIEEAPQLLLSVIIFYHNSPGIGNKFLQWDTTSTE